MLILGEFSLFISLSLQCSLCFLCDACNHVPKFSSLYITGWLTAFPYFLRWFIKNTIWQFSMFATQHLFFSSCSISCLVYHQEHPYPAWWRQGQHFLCDSFFNQHITLHVYTSFFLYHAVTGKPGLCYVTINCCTCKELFNLYSYKCCSHSVS